MGSFIFSITDYIAESEEILRNDLDAILAGNGAEALFLYSESFRNVNMYYLTKFLAPDPFILFKKLDTEPTMVINTMEFPRAKKESVVKDIRSYVDYNFMDIIKAAEEPKFGVMKFLATVAKKELGKGTVICVPYNFLAIATDVLRKEGLTVEPMFDIVEKARETKETDEIDEIKSVQMTTEKVTTRIVDIIGNCEVDSKGILIHNADGRKEPLTAGKVKSMMAHAFIDKGIAVEEDLIVACGPSSADPHYHGRADDKLKANQPIILDIYPRSMRKRYWTDMTRTIVKGKASNEVKKMFEVVLEAKNASTDALHEGILGSDAFNLCCDIIERAGYETIRGGKQIEKGLTHSLGHGVGLEIHEGPTMSEVYKFPLKEHNVVTVEPGLYDPKIGGVRIEDLVEITKSGCNNLTKMEIQLEV